MSAYRRLNRTARPLTLQTNSYPLFSNSLQYNDSSSSSITSNNWLNDKHNQNDNDLTSLTSSMFLNGSDAGNNSINHNNNHSIDSIDNNIINQLNATQTAENILQSNSTGNQITIIPTPITTNASYVPQPKHIRFPDVPYQSELLNELMIFSYTFIAAAMQFLHLYRTVWWLPESNTDQAMNFYLIDTHLTIFIAILLSRRFVYCFLMKTTDLLCSKTFLPTIRQIVKFTFFIGILLILGILCIKMFHKQRYIVIYLCYPLIVYVITFGFRIEPFLRTIFEIESSTYFNSIPSHSCSTNPITIRTEIDILRNDYNNRFKQVVFTSLLNAYYAAFIPCCFAQNFLYYDLYWATQHLGFLVFGSFTMCTMFCFPANYCDVLHMASLHLGKWIKIETRSYAPPAILWSKLIVWPSGAFVKYSGELYKANGIVTTAIPANGVHARFYVFFQNPANIYLILSIIQSAIVLLQIIILFMVVEWHNVISLSYLLLANYHTLFKIVRDFFVTHQMYTSESNILEKTNSSTPLN